MALLKKKSPEEVQADVAAKQQQRRDAEERKQREQLERDRRAFEESPAGRARASFANGDQVFQCSIDVMTQRAIIVSMVGGTTSRRSTDPVAILNSVCREGWEIVNGSFVFVEQGQESRDKFMSSGQNVAVKGQTVGYYVFRRSETNRRAA